MRAWISDRWQNARASLWLVPGAIVLAFAALAFAFLQIDRRNDTGGHGLLFGGDSSAAQEVLSTIAGSLITVAGLIFTVTMVVLQLASSQYSPRLLRTFLSDRVTQVTAGVYVGLFVYCLLVLRAVRGEDFGDFIPALSITTSIVLAVLALALLLTFISHLVSLIQVDNIAAEIHRTLVASVERQSEAEDWSDADGRPEGAGEPVYAPRAGYIQTVAPEQTARELDGGRWRVEARFRPGEFVPTDEAVAVVYGDDRVDDDVRAAVAAAFNVANERDVGEDPAFAVRQLADVALKGISPSINDPTTAVTCVGYLRSGLVELGSRPPRPHVVELDGGRIAFSVPPPSLVEIAEPLLQVGRHAPRVTEVGIVVVEALAAVVAAAAEARPDEAEVLAERARELARFLAEAAEPDSQRARLEAAAGSIGAG